MRGDEQETTQAPDCTCWLCEQQRDEGGARLDDDAVRDAADLFLSFTPDNNRPTSAEDIHAARMIVGAYFQRLRFPAPTPGARDAGE